MSDPDFFGYQPPSVRVTVWQDGQIIDEPPIQPDDTHLIQTIPVSRAQLRNWRGVVSSVVAPLKGIGWNATADALQLIADQIDRALGGSDAHS